MTQDNIFKIKTLLNLKYLDCIMPSMHKMVDNIKTSEDYTSFNLDDVDYSLWQQWKLKNQIKENLSINEKNFIRIEGVAKEILFLPEEFAEKIIILGFLP